MIARQLAAWSTRPLQISDEVREAALRHILDGLGTALAAVRTRAVEPVLAVSRDLGGPAESLVLGDRDPIGAPAAALANGALVHALDFDDTHAGGLVHATAVVLPAALAVGQQLGASGTDVLDAVVVGYETVCRIAAAAPHGFHARGLHATMVAGVFSSAVVTARLMTLDEERTVAALGIAGSSAGGLLAFLSTGASTKQLHPGLASQAGIVAARLAAAGATGPDTVLDGAHDIYESLATGPVDRASIVDGLGVRWETTRIGIKPYAACQLSHAAIDAARAARRAGNFALADVVEVVVDVHPDSAGIVCDDSRDLSRPASPYAAKFSLPWCVAALLVDGRLTLGTFSSASIARIEIGDLARRVRWRPLLAPTTAAANAPGRVEVRLRDGREIVGSVPCSSGGGEQPLTRQQLLAKFTDNVGGDPVLAAAVADEVADLPSARGIGVLFEAVAAAADQHRQETAHPACADSWEGTR